MQQLPYNLQVKRRVPSVNMDNRPIRGKYEEKVFQVNLVKQTPKGAWVRLSNGDEIFRKAKDIIGGKK